MGDREVEKLEKKLDEMEKKYKQYAHGFDVSYMYMITV